MFILVSSLQNPAIADIYTEHAHQVVVAKYAPSGFYIASGGTCLSSRMAPWSMWCAAPLPPVLGPSWVPGLGGWGVEEEEGRPSRMGMAGGANVMSFSWG